MDQINELKTILKNTKNLVVFTGAGISTASNIPDFRSSNGLYNEKTKINIRPEEIISHSFFVKRPKDFFEFYKTKMVYPNALPNRAHRFFHELEEKMNVTIVTQNIDGLHQKAGSKHVLELHGSVLRNYCMKCHKFYDLDAIFKEDIPYCECGGLIKPDVVLYEEALDYDVLREAVKKISEADTLIVVGTSLLVQPAAGLIQYYNGKNLIILNKETTPYDYYAKVVIHDDITKICDELSK